MPVTLDSLRAAGRPGRANQRQTLKTALTPQATAKLHKLAKASGLYIYEVLEHLIDAVEE